MHSQPSPSWQVVSEWVSRTGRETVEVVSFDSWDVARREADRLGRQLGARVEEQLLKSVQILGDYQSIWNEKT